MADNLLNGPILVWGAGAIGGTLGAAWARHGRDVLLVDSEPEHVAAMNAQGLAIEGPVETFTQDVKALTPDEVSGTFALIILAVKAHHTEAAAAALLPHLAVEGVVVSAQNGLNELALARIVGPARTFGCFVNYGADYLQPGRILWGNRAAVVVGEIDGRITERARQIHRLFQDFEPQAELTDDIWAYLWGKLGYGALLFATALTNASIADALASRRHEAVFRRVGEEVMRVAAARSAHPRGFNGFDPAAFAADASMEATRRSLEAMVAFNRGSAKTHSGIWRDLAVRRRRTEVDAQIGAICGIGAEAGVETPTLARLVALIHAIEDGEKPLDWATLDELAAP
jgi:2-dehydropantoate 2-reductase